MRLSKAQFEELLNLSYWVDQKWTAVKGRLGLDRVALAKRRIAQSRSRLAAAGVSDELADAVERWTEFDGPSKEHLRDLLARKGAEVSND